LKEERKTRDGDFVFKKQRKSIRKKTKKIKRCSKKTFFTYSSVKARFEGCNI